MHTRAVVEWTSRLAVIGALMLALAAPVLGENADQFLGYVDDGRFFRILSVQEPAWPISLTTISMQESIPPEAGRLDLSALEGRVIVVQGWDGGGWIYRAGVADVASAMLSQLILDLVGVPGRTACEACLARLNAAAREELEGIDPMDAGLVDAILAARPFHPTSCEEAHTIELLLENIEGVGEGLSKRIIMHFCPELYE